MNYVTAFQYINPSKYKVYNKFGVFQLIHCFLCEWLDQIIRLINRQSIYSLHLYMKLKSEFNVLIHQFLISHLKTL